MENTLDSEKKLITVMLRLYCHKKHGQEDLCPQCTALLTYATHRLTHCPFQNKKPACSHCTIHCYKPEMKKQIRQVMRFSGPRMLLYHPILLLRHILKK